MVVRPGRLTAAVLLIAALVGAPAAGASQSEATAQPRAARVVIVTLPGVTWDTIVDAPTPVIDTLVAEGAAATLSLRSAQRPATALRGYLALGAGSRVTAPGGTSAAHYAGPAGDEFENGTAAQAVARRGGAEPSGGIVHPGLPALAQSAGGPDYGGEVAALGTALRTAGRTTAVVSASDLSPDPGSSLSMRRDAVLAIADTAGAVDAGTLDGLLLLEPDAPFGVRTDPDAVDAALTVALEHDVILVEPGDTRRADEYIQFAPARADELSGQALAWTDDILGRIIQRLDPRRDLLIVATISSPSRTSRDRLGAVVMWGVGVEPGTLTSPTTRRTGIATLIDVAPTVLRASGVTPPASMAGTQMRVTAGPPSTPADLAALDRASGFRDELAPIVVTLLILALVLMSVLAFVVFLHPARPPALAVAARLAAYAALAVPPASVLLRLIAPADLGVGAAVGVLVGIVAALVATGLLFPGPAWSGGVALLGLSLALGVGDLLAGSPLQLNSAFGYSPILGGRFYGLGNVGFAMILAAGILTLTGVADLRGRVRASWWMAAGLVLLVPLVGLPPLGADFGGMLAAVPAILVTFALGRAWRIRLPLIAAGAAASIAVTAGASLLDMLRPPAARTHLGRFAAEISSGGLPVLLRTIDRKLDGNLSVLGSTAWTYTIPLGIAVLVLLLWRPRGVLSRVIPAHPLLRAGLWGSMVGGVIGFAVNDSGVAIPGMVLAHVVPLFVLLAVSVARQPPSLAEELRAGAHSVP